MSFEIQNQYTLLSKYSVYLRAKLQMNGRKQGGNLKKKYWQENLQICQVFVIEPGASSILALWPTPDFDREFQKFTT